MSEGRRQSPQLLLSGPDGVVQLQDRSFSRRETLDFQLRLLPGIYGLEFRLTEGSTEARVDGVQITQP